MRYTHQLLFFHLYCIFFKYITLSQSIVQYTKVNIIFISFLQNLHYFNVNQCKKENKFLSSTIAFTNSSVHLQYITYRCLFKAIMIAFEAWYEVYYRETACAQVLKLQWFSAQSVEKIGPFNLFYTLFNERVKENWLWIR